MKPTIIGLYGESDSGKTHLITKIIQQLSKDNLKIATVKKTNKPISIDTKGKDTYLHGKAGAKLTVFSTSSETTFIVRETKKTPEIINMINCYNNFDLILIEGCNDSNISKIRVGSAQKRNKTILDYNENIEEVIILIKKEIKNNQDLSKNEKANVTIFVNGKKVPLTEFPSDFIASTIKGMVSTLKGVDEIKTVDIKLKF